MRYQYAPLSALLFAFILPLLNHADCVATDATRLVKLQSLQKSIGRKLIPLSVDTFENLIESAPRSYGMLVMFSAPPHVCQPCATMSRQLDQIVNEYYRLPSNRGARKPLFFAEVKLSQSDQVFFSHYNIRHVPILYYFPPGQSKTYPKPLEESSPNSYQLQQHGVGANSIKEFINERTGSRMKIVRGNYQIPFVQTVRDFKPLILLIVAISSAIAVYTGAYKSPMLWFGLVVLVYIFSVGGGHYSWIHNVPLAVVNKEGRTEYIASGSRSQYVAEGFFVSLTCVSISVFLILLQELPSVMPNKAGQSVVGMVLVFLTICAITALLVMYHFKMPQYLQYNELS